MIAKAVKGKGFRGVLEYCLRQEKGYLLESNMAGSSPRELAKEFGEIRKLRPNLNGTVSHVSIALPAGESLSDKQWKDVAQKYLAHMGFENSQFVAVRHTDRDHQHMHLVINRVTMGGNVVSDSNNYRRQEKLMRELEKEYGLQTVKSSDRAGRKTLTKGEIEKAMRTEEIPIRMKLQNAVDTALRRTSDLKEFTAFLATQDIDVRLNQTTTGQIRGISFAAKEVAMKGSDLGKAYTWSALLHRGLQYEQDGCDKGNEQESHENDGDKQLGLGNAARQDEYGQSGLARMDDQERRIVESTTRPAPTRPESSRNSSLVRTRSKGLSR